MSDNSKVIGRNIQQDLFGHAHAEMYCDGASSGNPGDSGIGVLIDLDDDGKCHQISEYIGTATNNIAEYSALIKGLEVAMHLGVQKINIYMDSELLVRQINGIYRVKHKNLVPLWTRAMELLKHFYHYKVTHIPREENKKADALARSAIARKRSIRK